MTKTQHFHNRPEISEGPGYRADEAGGGIEETGIGGEGGKGKESATNRINPSPTEQSADDRTSI